MIAWLWYQVKRTGQDLYADKWEMAPWLIALAFLAFIIFYYPHQ
jgi:hypothetical protein